MSAISLPPLEDPGLSSWIRGAAFTAAPVSAPLLPLVREAELLKRIARLEAALRDLGADPDAIHPL